MPREILLLRLEGPMQSWGTRARWDIRDTGLEPTKSGVIGLLGCALGLPRNNSDLEMLDRQLQFGIRLDQPGFVATDYHTVTGYHRTAGGSYKYVNRKDEKLGTANQIEAAMQHAPTTIVSKRDYLHDAAFLVALSSNTPGLLRRLAGTEPSSDWEGSLQSPKWPLYLGRKSCVPTRPVLYEITDRYEDIEDALRKVEPIICRHNQTQKERYNAWIECPDGKIERQDAIRLNQLRFYGFRRCRHVEVIIEKAGG